MLCLRTGFNNLPLECELFAGSKQEIDDIAANQAKTNACSKRTSGTCQRQPHFFRYKSFQPCRTCVGLNEGCIPVTYARDSRSISSPSICCAATMPTSALPAPRNDEANVRRLCQAMRDIRSAKRRRRRKPHPSTSIFSSPRVLRASSTSL